MSEALLKNVQEMLNEEKWTRATLSNYSASQFKELDTILKEAREGRFENELKKLMDEHLSHTKNSIIALYLGGMTALSQQIIDDSAMISLVSIFLDNHKWVIVRYLCERILDYGESKFALRTLIDCHKNENDEEGVFEIWERLVKVDHEEADLAKTLAERFEKQGDIENAIDYLKKALHRYIAKHQFNNVKEIWDKLLGYCPEEIDFFLHIQKRVAKNFDEQKAGSLLKEMYDVCIKRDDLNTGIAVLKLILDYDNDDRHARREITECYRKKYADHSQLDDYIRVSSLAQGPRNVKEAVQDFEKHIAFDKGNFVFHRTWGVGRIGNLQGDDIVIDFSKQRGHAMSLKMAVNALQTLAKDHIWVLKAVWKKEKLHEKVKAEPAWALKTVIKSFGNSCDFKRIKSELVPSVLSVSEWTGWSTKAREILKTDPSFGLNPDNIDLFIVRERPISVEEKLYNEFKAARNIFERAQVLQNFASKKEAEQDSEYFNEMFDYFAAYLKSYHQVSEQVVVSYLLVKELIGQYPYLVGAGIRINFTDLYNGIEDAGELFVNLKDLRLKEEFLKNIRLFIPAWPEIYIKLFPRCPINTIILHLQREGYADKLRAMAINCFENYRDYRESAVWLFKNSSDEPWFKEANIAYEKQLIALIHILDNSYRDIENRRDTSESRKLNKQVYTILFKENVINNYFDTTNTETIVRLYTFINAVKDLDPADKMNLRNRILKKHPDFKFFGTEEKKTASLGLLVTSEKLQEKKKQLAHINEVDIPINYKELEAARLHGDFKENAEYHAARDKQNQLTSLASKLSSDIDRAKTFDPTQVNTQKISFGTKVTLLNKSSNEKEEFTILGPWESDPKNHIISYQSPFGEVILNKAVGDEVEFLNNDERISYSVEKISSAF
ncbi:MAG: transcription elongation factor GreA [Treponema sp.]|nr:transcription elongation factor GreA [Treponema sp.]